MEAEILKQAAKHSRNLCIQGREHGINCKVGMKRWQPVCQVKVWLVLLASAPAVMQMMLSIFPSVSVLFHIGFCQSDFLLIASICFCLFCSEKIWPQTRYNKSLFFFQKFLSLHLLMSLEYKRISLVDLIFTKRKWYVNNLWYYMIPPMSLKLIKATG